ncbi:MAG: methyltransferase domain-containing protein [Phycisphaerales bacterium]|nr:methyltransferase domain-containing protein [Phycisphaerales bacterium]
MKRRARHQFDAWAQRYDRSLLNHFLFEPSYLVLMEEIARWHAEHGRTSRVLDVGSGTGTFAGLVAESAHPARIIGLDYAANMCVRASAKSRDSAESRRPAFVNGDSEHLPFADGSFDLITCANSFHHYPHQQEVVVEMKRVLAPGGRLIIIDGFRDCVIGWFVFDVVIDHIEKNVHHVPWTAMHAYFEAAGFRDIRRRKFNFWFPAFATIADRE